MKITLTSSSSRLADEVMSAVRDTSKGCKVFVLLSSFLNTSSLETPGSYAKSRDMLFQYLLGKTDALVPLPFLADEISSWEPHFQIVLQQKSHFLDCLFSKSAPSDLNVFSAVLYS